MYVILLYPFSIYNVHVFDIIWMFLFDPSFKEKTTLMFC